MPGGLIRLHTREHTPAPMHTHTHTHTHTNTHTRMKECAITRAHVYSLNTKPYCFSKAAMIRGRASLLRYTYYIVSFVFLSIASSNALLISLPDMYRKSSSLVKEPNILTEDQLNLLPISRSRTALPSRPLCALMLRL